MRVQAPFEAWSTGMACFIERNTVMVSDFWYDQIFQRLDEKFIWKWRKLILAKLLMVIRHGRGYGFVSLRGTQWWSLFFDTINDLRDRIKILFENGKRLISVKLLTVIAFEVRLDLTASFRREEQGGDSEFWYNQLAKRSIERDEFEKVNMRERIWLLLFVYLTISK